MTLSCQLIYLELRVTLKSMSKSPHPSQWARDSDEEDRVEAIIRGTGCWDQHIAVVDCKGDKGDWRECQKEVQLFKECMQKNRPKATIPAEKK
ncbi:hypothetical protein Y032_0368g73 [Ancylostoma ceylanicum]|uniref:CHCH domain-containing protein n=1 Tax=Ancylostoma ceylanicum TaxID=53326 RepID=A0A016RVG4_9BILA|nr:hypothetical protein Y032_0368g73 [Ancylostoma ceylanicum]